jgi:hypothetical protein
LGSQSTTCSFQEDSMKRLLLPALLALLAANAPASASVIGVTSRAALGDNDRISWSAFGPDGGAISTPDSRLSVHGHTIGVHASDGVFRLRVEGVSHHGGFTPGSFLLTHEGSDDRATISFDDQSVRGVGFHIQPLFAPDYEGGFTAMLLAFAADATLLGSADFTGTVSHASDGSAPFVGLLSTGFDIAWIELRVIEPPGTPFEFGANLAIDTAFLVEPVRVIPEPASIALLGGALLALGLVRRRRASCA